MMTPRDFSASRPVSPTTAAIAPNAPTGAAHMTIASTRKTSRWRWPMPRRTGSPAEPIAWSAKPDEQRDQQRLEHLALGEGGHQRRRDDAEQELAPCPRSRPSASAAPALARGVGQMQAAARLQDVADDQADAERDVDIARK